MQFGSSGVIRACFRSLILEDCLRDAYTRFVMYVSFCAKVFEVGLRLPIIPEHDKQY